MKTVAVIPIDPHAGALGHPRSLGDRLGKTTVLELTLARLADVRGLDEIVLVSADAEIDLPHISNLGVPIRMERTPERDDAAVARRRRVRRAWSPAAWRGGFKGATVWDELAPLSPLADTAEARDADTVILAGPDWCVLDPAVTQAALAVHRDHPEAMPLAFSQAPPGLCPLVVSTKLLRDMANTNRGFADVLAYTPSRPALDPISQDFNAAVPASVRGTARRFIYDTPESVARLHRLAESLGPEVFASADATQITDAARGLEIRNASARFENLPPILEIELTPRRIATGPITPQHHANLDRPDFDLDQLTENTDHLRGRAVTLGGIGEPLLHRKWTEAITRCRQAGAAAVALQTDLLTGQEDDPQDRADGILDADPDVVFVRLNAESGGNYEAAMGIGRFGFVMQTLQALFTSRAARARQRGDTHAFPLIVPTLTKTSITTPEMDTFFERWWQLADHAVIDRFPQGGRGHHALADDLNPVPMDPPWRDPDPHQSKHRLTVLSDGTVTPCHEDWLGRASLGNLRDATLHELWQTLPEFQIPEMWRHDDAPVCPRCFGFLSLHAQSLAPETVPG